MSREGLQTPPPVAQITIVGALSKEHIVALVDVAMSAGAALMVQPRAAAPAAAPVIEAAPTRRALPPASSAKERRAAKSSDRRDVTSERRGVSSAPPPADDRVRRALSNGPLRVAEFLRETRLDKRAARRLVDEGVIVATGVTNGRRYALPGHPAKEAP